MAWWGLLAVVAPLGVAVVRELVALRKDAARRHSIERLVAGRPSGLRIVDRASDGAVLEIVVAQARS